MSDPLIAPGKWQIKLRLWFYNNIKRHWQGWRAWGRWRKEWTENRDPRLFPRYGRITPENLEWALNTMTEIRTAKAKEIACRLAGTPEEQKPDERTG